MSRYWIKITSFLKPPMSIVDSCFVLSSWPPTHRHLIGAPACVILWALSLSWLLSAHPALFLPPLFCHCSMTFYITLCPGHFITLQFFYGLPATYGRTSLISESSPEGTWSFVPQGSFFIASPMPYLVHPRGPEDTRLFLMAGPAFRHLV